MTTPSQLVQYVITDSSLTLVWSGRSPTVITSSHLRFPEIAALLVTQPRNAETSRKLEALLDYVQIIDDFFAPTNGALVINRTKRQLLYKGEPMNHVIEGVIFQLLESNQDVLPLSMFMERLLLNPCQRTIDELYRWVETNGFQITSDGYLIAYKRVRDDLKSFYDGSTYHPIGGYVEMDRADTDTNPDNTCSRGLHFCSNVYLNQYHGGQGRVLILKIDPADIVAIPSDYKQAKGRACRYKVLGDLVGPQLEAVETTNVIHGSIYPEETLVEKVNQHDEDYVTAYRIGYKAGRGKQRNLYRNNDNATSYIKGYQTGYADGRGKQPKTY